MAVVSAMIIAYLNHANKLKRMEIVRLEKEFGSGGGGDGVEGWDSRKEGRRLGDRHPRFVYTL